ncbi:MAG: DAK2 domain-containing protein [Anaerolineae bacterium]|nr:DAK2 domain-containing protein [Anaerolineae bacterium]
MGIQEGDVMYALDGDDLKPMIQAAMMWLRQHQAAINALNVFPVPDGDTGTNMVLTMTSAWDEIEAYQDVNIGRLASRMAHGALMGARGNSGVILSQIWRGFARSLDDKTHMRASDLVAAMQEAADTAYKGVVKPVEGTILTVIREVAEEAQAVELETQDIVHIFHRMLERAKAAEARTPTLLPVLRQAGVVDSGGQGLVVILEGMWRYLKGLPVEGPERLARVVDLVTMPVHSYEDEALHFDSHYPYDVQFIVMGHNLDVAQMRATIEAMGDCPLVVGDFNTVKVHVHVADPGEPISYGAKCGSLHDVVVEDMQAQYQEYISGRDMPPIMGLEMTTPVTLLQEEAQTIGVVVVAAGDGLERVFRSLGATIIVQGGQTMNPSTAEILAAVEQVPAEQVIILPNNKNILMASEQAARMSKKEVAVVPTRSIPQGVSALLAMDQQATIDGNVVVMLNAAKDIISGEVTWAVRDVELNGIEVREGDAIGLLDGELVVDTGSYDEAVHWLLAEANLDERELVTLYYGEDVEEVEATSLVETLYEAYPDLEFEIVTGGQPHYPYIISIE